MKKSFYFVSFLVLPLFFFVSLFFLRPSLVLAQTEGQKVLAPFIDAVATFHVKGSGDPTYTTRMKSAICPSKEKTGPLIKALGEYQKLANDNAKLDFIKNAPSGWSWTSYQSALEDVKADLDGLNETSLNALQSKHCITTGEEGGKTGEEGGKTGEEGGKTGEEVGTEGVKIDFKLKNPIDADTLDAFLKDLLNILITLGIPIIAIMIIYSGYLFISAQGDEEKLKKAKATFFWVVIGAAIILGSWILAQAIKGTIEKLGGG